MPNRDQRRRDGTFEYAALDRAPLPPKKWHIKKNHGSSRGWLVWCARWDTPLPIDALRFQAWQDAVAHVQAEERAGGDAVIRRVTRLLCRLRHSGVLIDDGPRAVWCIRCGRAR